MNKLVQLLVAVASVMFIGISGWFIVETIFERRQQAAEDERRTLAALEALDRMQEDAQRRKAADEANAAQQKKDKAISECIRALHEWYATGKEVRVGAPGEPRHLDSTECQALVDDKYSGTASEKMECRIFLSYWSAGAYREEAKARAKYCLSRL